MLDSEQLGLAPQLNTDSMHLSNTIAVLALSNVYIIIACLILSNAEKDTRDFGIQIHGFPIS
jgi:hypothetical protein